MTKDFARAKINLTLQVTGRRADGYHELQSLVVFADYADVLTLDTTRPRGCTISGPFGDQISGDNLVDTALELLAQRHSHLQLGAVHLDKKLPLSAGIGGGSADAAAVLRLIKSANHTSESLLDSGHHGRRAAQAHRHVGTKLQGNGRPVHIEQGFTRVIG